MPVPGFLLQPLVENAIRHGVGPRLSGGHVEVTATRQRLVPLDSRPRRWRRAASRLDFERDAGVGLSNVASRLEHLYGQPNLLKLVPLASGGVEARIDLPSPPAPQPPGRRVAHE